MNVKGYDLSNPEKLERALHGTIVTGGNKVGGVAREDGTFDDDALLAEYDKLGGLITKGTDKVKTGSFYDFANKKPFANPKVIFTYRVNDKVVEVEEGVELPGVVKAAKVLAEEEAKEEEKEEPKLGKRKYRKSK